MAEGYRQRLQSLVSKHGLSGAALDLVSGKLNRAGGALIRWGHWLNYYGQSRFPHRSQQALLTNNASLEGILSGRRAFVLATGPSSKEIDLGKLRGEVVIATNESFKILDRAGIAPFAVAVIDAAYCSEREQYRRFWGDLSAYARRHDAIVFLNIESWPFFKAHGVFDDSRVHYLKFVGDLVDLGPLASEIRLQLTRAMPGLYTVSHAAAAAALACGAEEVYLLGVDFDYLVTPLLAIQHGYGDNEYNDHDRHSALDIYAREKGWDYADILRHVQRQQRCFQILAKIAAANGQRLANATPGGLLETLPRVQFDSLFQVPTTRSAEVSG